jgi:competence protein ComGC
VTRLPGRRARGRRVEERDRGISLVEMAVVLLLLGLIVPVIYGLVDSVVKDQAMVTSRDNSTSQAQVIGRVLSRQLHAAAIPSGLSSLVCEPPPNGSTQTTGCTTVMATANELELFANLGNANGPTRLDIKPVANGSTYNLVEYVTQPSLNSSGLPTYGSTSSTYVLGTGLVPPTLSGTNGQDCSTSTPGIFQYYNAGGTCLKLDTTETTPALDAGQLSGTSGLENVTVTLTTQDALYAKTSPKATTTLEITFPNYDYSDEYTTTTT